jgi:hypothetical protein
VGEELNQASRSTKAWLAFYAKKVMHIFGLFQKGSSNFYKMCSLLSGQNPLFRTGEDIKKQCYPNLNQSNISTA